MLIKICLYLKQKGVELPLNRACVDVKLIWKTLLYNVRQTYMEEVAIQRALCNNVTTTLHVKPEQVWASRSHGVAKGWCHPWLTSMADSFKFRAALVPAVIDQAVEASAPMTKSKTASRLLHGSLKTSGWRALGRSSFSVRTQCESAKSGSQFRNCVGGVGATGSLAAGSR